MNKHHWILIFSGVVGITLHKLSFVSQWLTSALASIVIKPVML